ncbi:MAG: carboxypeptidase-like regulatory domain-containing protein [bacterium]
MSPRAVLVILMVAVALLAGCSGKSQSVSLVTSREALPADKGAIAGVVIDDRYRPVADAFLLLTPVGMTASSDGEGQFAFIGLQPGTYVLQVQSKDHEAAPKNIDVVAGQYTEVEAEARRTFSEGAYIVTTEYSIFIGCSFSYVSTTWIGVPYTGEDCLLDQSGDSTRFGFDSDYRAYGKNVTYLVAEMKANHKASGSNGAYKVVIRNSETANPYYASKFTVDSDYLRLTLKYGNVSLDDTESRNAKWLNKDKIQTALFPQGGFKSESQQAMDAECSVDPTGQFCYESRGLGPQFGVKAKFVQTLFIGPPHDDVAKYCVLADAC